DGVIIGGEGDEPVGVIVHNGQNGVAGAAQGGGGVGAVDGGAEEAEVDRAVAIHQLVVRERDQKGLGCDVPRIPGEGVSDGGEVNAGEGGAVGGGGLDGERALAAAGASDGDGSGAGVFVGTKGGGGEVEAA